MDFFRGERCGIDNCPSRRYHVENGQTFCHRGHEQFGQIEQTQDFEDLNFTASQTTRIRDRSEENKTRAELNNLGGPYGLKLFRLAYEYLLRRQILILVNEKNFPADLEIVAQEIWALRVGIARSEGVDLDRDSIIDVRKKGAADKSSSTSSDSNSESESSERIPPYKLPKFIEMFSMCYVAAITLRIPLPINSLYEWIVNEELLYLRAEREIPQEMRRKFVPRFHRVFQVFKPITPQKLHESIADFVYLLHSRIKTLTLPPLNWRVLMFNCLLQLGLPLQIYVFVESLSRNLELQYNFPVARGRTWHSYLLHLPSLRLVGMIVFATKYLYPFDNHIRYAESTKDLCYLELDWIQWQRTHERRQDEQKQHGHPFKSGEILRLTDKDIPDLTLDQIDSYMDWCAGTFLEPDGTSTNAKGSRKHGESTTSIANYFPINSKKFRNKRRELDSQELEDSLTFQLMRDVYGSMKPRQIVSKERAAGSRSKILRPGSKYPRYVNETELKTNKTALAFHQRVVEVTGISMKTLLRVVYDVEKEVKACKGKIEDFIEENCHLHDELEADESEADQDQDVLRTISDPVSSHVDIEWESRPNHGHPHQAQVLNHGEERPAAREDLEGLQETQTEESNDSN